ncbi:MAG: HDOD domain-containing protein [Cyanobacteria bacterium HKST-UBA04]|nr:HDOD domain-containing protein [Cyanobacteria bacterium HKST-UBA04]
MSNPALLNQIVQILDQLPDVPVVALEVNRLLDDPDVSAQDLADVISRDPSLTSKVLKLCNSAEYGFSRKIATISEAVSILGQKELKRIIFVIISHSLLSRPIEGYALEAGALWENALTCAVYAKHIAKSLRPDNTKLADLAFTGALLRDIGKIVLTHYVATHAKQIEAMAVANKLSYAKAEEMVLGMSHTDVGRVVAERFNFPQTLLSAICYHHHPGKMPDGTNKEIRDMVCMVHLADAFTMLSGEGLGVDGLMYPLDEAVFDQLNIGRDTPFFESLYNDLLELRGTINNMNQMVR